MPDVVVVGLIVVLILLALLLAGMPLAFAFGAAAVISAFIFNATGSLDMLAYIIYGGIDSFVLLAIPLFILMGGVIAASPAGHDLYEGIHRFLYRLPGGLAMSNIGACAIFSAMCGSSPATAAAIGTTGIPEMRKRGVSDELAVGSIVGGGTLGILIPPSITMIIYGVATETSVGKLFIAGVLPGILLIVLFDIWALIATVLAKKEQRQRNESDESLRIPLSESYSWSEKVRYLPKLIPFILLVTGLMYAIYGGVATPSEAAAVGAMGAIILVLIFYRQSLTRKTLFKIMNSTVNQTAMIMLIAATSVLFGSVLVHLNITQQLTDLIVSIEASRWIVMAVINLFLLLLGMFIPPFAIILLTAPLLLPIIIGLGFDPIWFGVIVTINMEAGCITPPLGINLFIVQGIAPDISMGRIMKGALPFFLIILLLIVIVSIFPALALWLPGRMR